MSEGSSHKPSSTILQPPTGTRDFYPAELNRLRYIHEAWRRTSINHGFDEIDGPTFEHLDLYTIKSGEGIVSELFSFERFGGEKTFALRPEFTPTLARMYASKANSLPKPTKWFWQQNCFRAERPQRGRLREFSQWNCDIIGTDSPTNEPEAQARMDAEIIATCVGLLQKLGLAAKDIRVKISDRNVIVAILKRLGVSEHNLDAALRLLDKSEKLSKEALQTESNKIEFPIAEYFAHADRFAALFRDGGLVSFEDADFRPLRIFAKELVAAELNEWCELDLRVARGLAYYTGMVFEVIVDGERAVAGGGRYDKLIELFGGPPTPAVGFGMGDVVLSLVLQDKGLLPTDDAIAEKLGLRPDALVISNGTPEADAQVAPVLAQLRSAGLHARRSYKATKNVGKLIQDAAKLRARFCVILESGTQATVKNMDAQGVQESCALSDIPSRIARAH